MNKIGFAITRASQGTGSVLTCNEGAWTSQLTDIREYTQLFGATLDGNCAIPFLKFIEEGCFLGIIRHIVGSIDDFFGGWIYIPRNISVSGEDLRQLLEYAQGVLTEENVSLKAAEITTRFSATYPERYSSPYIPSEGDRYGVRNPQGMSSLVDILEHRYQESYKGFKAIFLTDPMYVANDFKSIFGNFTNRKLEKSFIVIPPTDVSSFGNGTKLLVHNGTKYVHFSSPVRTKEGTPLRMSLKRPPFDSYRFTYNATKDNDVIDLTPLKFEWQIRVSRSVFHVYGEDHKPIVDAIIRIGNEIVNGDLLVKESKAKNAEVSVSAVGYLESTVVLDLFNMEDKIEINLVRSSANYTRQIRLADGRTGLITIEAAGLNPATSPLQGYIVNDKGVLDFNRGFRFKQRAIGFGFALVLCAVLGLGIWGATSFFGGEDRPQIAAVNDSTLIDDEEEELMDSIDDAIDGEAADEETAAEEAAEEKAEEQKPAEPAAPAYSDEALAVLKKDVWKKRDLEKHEELAGLFDALNNYRLDELTGNGKWAAVIKQTQPELADFLATGFPEAKYRNKSFLPDRDTSKSITISTFKKYVNAAADRIKNPKPVDKPKSAEKKKSSDEHRHHSSKPADKKEEKHRHSSKSSDSKKEEKKHRHSSKSAEKN